MIRVPPQINRPRLLTALVGLAAAGGISACFSLFSLAAALGSSPLGIRAGADRLEATLATADWRQPGRGGPVVYLATAEDCTPCMEYTSRAIRELRQDGYEVRVLELMPGGSGPRHTVLRDIAAENGADMQLPAMFWRHGGEWRADFGGDRDVRQTLRADLGPDT